MPAQSATLFTDHVNSTSISLHSAISSFLCLATLARTTWVGWKFEIISQFKQLNFEPYQSINIHVNTNDSNFVTSFQKIQQR